MNNVFDFLEKYKYSLLIVFTVYIALFIYLQVDTYERWEVIPSWNEEMKIEKDQEIELKPENIEVNKSIGDVSKDIKSISRDINDKGEKSNKDWSPIKSTKQIEDEVKALESKMFAETGGEQKREKIRQEQTIDKEKLSFENNNKAQKKSNSNNIGSNKVFSGNVMVDWELKNRNPLQNNSWYVRNPGYTCGSGSNGRVFIKIKVDISGNVLNATYNSEMSQNANECMITQAKKYALLSRFSYDEKAEKIQEGYIIYTFISQ